MAGDSFSLLSLNPFTIPLSKPVSEPNTTVVALALTLCCSYLTFEKITEQSYIESQRNSIRFWLSL